MRREAAEKSKQVARGEMVFIRVKLLESPVLFPVKR